MDILFVEDDVGLIFLLKRFHLWQGGIYRIKAVANDGREALKLLHQEHFQVVLTDIRMPVMDGIELLHQIRKERIQVQVILASDYSDFQYAKEGLRLGAVDYIEKPYTEEKLLEAFRLLQVNSTGKIPTEKKQKLFQQLLRGKLSEELKNIPEDKKDLLADFDGRIELVQDLWERLSQRAVPLPFLEKIPEKDGLLEQNGLFEYVRYLENIVEKYHLQEPDVMTNQMGTFLSENVREAGMLHKLADEMELSKDYINRIFREKWGLPISEYCTLVKMNRAKELLETTNCKVYEIAESLGYSTVDYFGRLFKSCVGCTPVHYRKTHKK